MKVSWKEWLSVVVTVVGLIGIPLWVAAYNRSFDPPGRRVIHLTGVMKDGAWTTETVNSMNYGLKTFTPAEINIRRGERVLLRLASADVTHGFYVPELGLGPVEVEPGHIEEIEFDADTVGTFTYYCTTVCGDCHHFMRGVIRIGESEGDLHSPGLPAHDLCTHQAEDAHQSSRLAERGRSLYQQKGCVACHGKSGHGGIRNHNYIKDSVPNLNMLAERMHLYDPEDVDTVIGLMEHGANLAAIIEDPPFRRFNRFLAQYESIRNVIRDGKPAGRRDTTGVFPPMNMPSWEIVLTDREIDALIVYLLTEFPWDEELE